MSQFNINNFPPSNVGESPVIMRKLVEASKALAYLEGIQTSLPNPELISQTLPLQEAQDSSEIESIVTTTDALYKSRVTRSSMPIAIKEVISYSKGMELGIAMLKKEEIISISNIKAIQEEVIGNNAGFRVLIGTDLTDKRTNEVVYIPPQTNNEIMDLLHKLLKYINLDNGEHPLIKMAVMHHQFESIHPFYDGNGRTGRILNLLYLMKEKEISSPVLYLSRFINHNRLEYYRLLQAVRDEARWEEWILFMLTGVADTANQTAGLVKDIKEQFAEHKEKVKSDYKFYSHELLNYLYAYPYTRIAHMAKSLKIDPRTATKYLNHLSAGGILSKTKMGTGLYYINRKLYDILTSTPSLKT